MEIKETLQEVFRDVFDDEEIEISDQMTAGNLEDWDSLAHIRLIVAVETAFSVKFTTAEVQRLKNVGEFIGLIADKLSES